MQVTWADPRGDTEREWVRIGDVTGDQDSAAIGRLRRKELFRVEILVSIVKSEVESPQATAERAYVLAAAIENAIRPDETLGVANLLWARVEKTDLREGLAGGERWAEVTVHVGCQSRI